MTIRFELHMLFALGAALLVFAVPPPLQGQKSAPPMYRPIQPAPPYVQKQAPPQFRPQSPEFNQQTNTLLSDGRKYLKEGKFPQAELAFRQFTQMSPSDPRGFFWLGLTIDEEGDAPNALKAYARSLDNAKDLSMDCAELRINLGNTLLKLNYLKEAVYDFKRALEIDPTQMLAHLGLAHAFLLNKQYGEALEQLQLCSEHAVIDPALPFLKARALQGLGRVGEAKAQLSQYERGVAGADGQLMDSARNLLRELSAEQKSSTR